MRFPFGASLELLRVVPLFKCHILHHAAYISVLGVILLTVWLGGDILVTLSICFNYQLMWRSDNCPSFTHSPSLPSPAKWHFNPSNFHKQLSQSIAINHFLYMGNCLFTTWNLRLSVKNRHMFCEKMLHSFHMHFLLADNIFQFVKIAH